MKKIPVLITWILLFASCNTAQHLHQSGTYTIKEREGNLTEFYEVKGKYNIVSDTLKINDKIVINVIKAVPLKNNAKQRDVAKATKN